MLGIIPKSSILPKRYFTSSIGLHRLFTTDLMYDAVMEASFYSQHRPLLVGKPSLPLKVNEILLQNTLPEPLNTTPEMVKELDELLCKLIKKNDIKLCFGNRRSLYLISILKRRRKKMNKHKWKKARRAVRDSSRYNKEKLRKAGKLRKKQE
jgi:hypothetical protein